MIFTLRNEVLTVKIESLGAELKSVQDTATGKEYMWDADPQFWKRTSPVLFPIVGSLRDNSYSYKNKTYQMSSHGFARDMEFELVSHAEEEIWMELQENSQTLQMYPFHFSLQCGYRLTGRSLDVIWRVVNREESETMYFSLGAHPAFNCSLEGEGLRFNTEEALLFSRINDQGCMMNYKNELKLEHGFVPFTNDFFADGVYIVEDYQASSVSLVDADGKDYVQVSFKAPLFGIWAPQGAPFVCIEPWYGRCDRETFTGRLDEREWANSLEPEGSFEREYTITFR